MARARGQRHRGKREPKSPGTAAAESDDTRQGLRERDDGRHDDPPLDLDDGPPRPNRGPRYMAGMLLERRLPRDVVEMIVSYAPFARKPVRMSSAEPWPEAMVEFLVKCERPLRNGGSVSVLDVGGTKERSGDGLSELAALGAARQQDIAVYYQHPSFLPTIAERPLVICKRARGLLFVAIFVGGNKLDPWCRCCCDIVAVVCTNLEQLMESSRLSHFVVEFLSLQDAERRSRRSSHRPATVDCSSRTEARVLSDSRPVYDADHRDRRITTKGHGARRIRPLQRAS